MQLENKVELYKHRELHGKIGCYLHCHAKNNKSLNPYSAMSRPIQLSLISFLISEDIQAYISSFPLGLLEIKSLKWQQ